MSRWLTEGRTLGESLRRFTCVVVAGGDADATAEVALGIAEAQAAHRRVVLGDLLGDARQFDAFRSDDDHHGLVDAFDYGISLSRVIRGVPGNDQLQFAPTGSHVADYAELLRHHRWKLIIASFAKSAELLVIALPVSAAGLEDLVYRTDGAVLVDSTAPAKLDPGQVIAAIKLKPALLPRTSAAMPALIPARSSATDLPVVKEPVPLPAKRPPPTIGPRPAAAAARRAGRGPDSPAAIADSRRSTGVFRAVAKPAGIGAVLGTLVVLTVFWFLNRPAGGPAAPAVVDSSVAIPSVAGPGALPPTTDPNRVDPADSGASVYAVQGTAFNTPAGAILNLQQNAGSMPVATFAPVEVTGRIWYYVLTGAFTTRGGADSLLNNLRIAGVLDTASRGVVVRVPYAVLIDSIRKSNTVAEHLKGLLDGRHLPAYALEQDNGWMWIFVGAFETTSQAESYAEQLRADGYPATVTLRKGRMF